MSSIAFRTLIALVLCSVPELLAAPTQTTDPIESPSFERNRKLSQWHFEEARGFLSKQQAARALAHAERFLELNPASKAARRLLAEARISLKDQQKRLAQKARLVAEAEQVSQEGRNRRASTLLKRALALDPDDQRIQQAYDESQARRRLASPRVQQASELGDAASQKPLLAEYQVSAGDVLEVFVWQQPDLTRNIIVRPDGKVSFPLVGDVMAVGTTLTELDALLTERLSTYLRLPDVSLAIRRFGGTKTIVLGEVARPGVYVPPGQGRVLEVIAMAGGFKKHAKQGNVMLIRGGLATPQLAKLDIKKMLRRGGTDENVILQPNDIIFVPKGRIVSAVDWVTQLSPALSELLVGQTVTTNFGVIESSGEATR